ncbi:MAG: hypothetical protein AAF348_17900 [Bacteroidota bacterium]
MTEISNIIDLIESKGAKWLRVNEQPCMHTFINDLYINLCLWKDKDSNVISIDVDNIENGISDIILKDIREGEQYFDNLFRIYSSYKENATNIALNC